ncbi:MAG: DUF3822 family protein [Bacteroidetes bacterium]|nr:DUF3822 family protein [Bacteroidota bacterium]
MLLHLHPYCFSFALVDKDLNKIVDFEAKVLEQSSGNSLSVDSVANWMKEHQQTFSLPFKNSKVAIYSTEFTILPYKSENIKDIFGLLGYAYNEDCTYLKNKIGEHFYLYYSLQDKLINFIENNLTNVEFYPCDYGLLHFYNSKLISKKYLAGNLYGDELTLCLKQDAQNFYYNKFPVKEKSDLLYYLRLAYEHLELNLDEFPTFLYGFIEEKSPMYSTTYGYIRNFEIDRTLKNTLPISLGVEEFPLHYYINLLGLAI